MTRLNRPIGGAILAAFAWWRSELSSLIPAGRHLARARQARTVMRLGPDAVIIEREAEDIGERFVDPRPVEALDSESWEQLDALLDGAATRIVLSPPDIFTTELRLPKAARSRLRSVVALQLGEISPLDPSEILWTVGAPRDEGGALLVAVTMVKIARVAALRELFAAHDLATPAIYAGTSDGDALLASSFRATGSRMPPALRRYLLCLSLLASIPVTTIAGASVLTAIVDTKSSAIEASLRPKVARDRAARQAERLREALAMLPPSSVSAVLSELAQRLPPPAWIRQIERTPDRLLRIVVDVDNPELARNALIGDPLLPALQEVDQLPGKQNRMLVTYSAGLP